MASTRPRAPGLWVRVLVVAAGTLLVVGGAAGPRQHSAAGPTEAPVTVTPTSPTSPPVEQSQAPAVPSATPAPVPDPAAPPPADPWTPLTLAIPAVGVDAPVEEYTDAMVRANDGWVDPPRRDAVAWWSGGGTPGRPADNTIYLYGHVSRLSAVFNEVPHLVPGDLISLTTPRGSIDYRVEQVLPPIPKESLPDDPTVNVALPGRLILIGCHREEDQAGPTTSNVVVVAQQID